jgi:hypothetical protein
MQATGPLFEGQGSTVELFCLACRPKPLADRRCVRDVSGGGGACCTSNNPLKRTWERGIYMGVNSTNQEARRLRYNVARRLNFRSPEELILIRSHIG